MSQRRTAAGGLPVPSKAPDRAALVDRLAALPTAEPIPPVEWEWLAAHGTLETFTAGTIVAPPGRRVEKLYVMLSGHMATYVDRGGGLRRVTEWHTGEVTGKLPYSRMGVTSAERTNRVEAASEVLTIHERDLTEMAARCPTFTALCVHTMLDRARSFSASALQDEKMVSLGKLAAGLAHELNNPASAAVRAATQLLAGLEEAEVASRALGAAGANAATLAALDRVRSACLGVPGGTVLSSLQQAEREDAIAGWLTRHGLDVSLAAPLADTAATLGALDDLAGAVPGEVLDAAVRWVAAGCASHALALEIRDATARIADLVAAVKRFTYMDSQAGPELVAVEPGLRDTIRVLASKAKAKGVAVAVTAAPGLPPVLATGSELNQVWMNLIDNALDAAPPDGVVTVDVGTELDFIAVRVTDDGPGIPEDVLPKIFDPFYTTKPPGEGTGLGLEIARRLVHRYRGEIKVESRPGRTTFCVRLPAGVPAAASPPAT